MREHAVVGRLTDLSPWEADLILSLRLWMDGPEGQAEVWNSFARGFGGTGGRAELRAFETMLHHICTHARRPLMRRQPGCLCLGADEATLLTLAREASRGELTEAAMIASLMVPARHAERIAIMAAQVGQAMQTIARRAPRQTHEPQAKVLH